MLGKKMFSSIEVLPSDDRRISYKGAEAEWSRQRQRKGQDREGSSTT